MVVKDNEDCLKLVKSESLINRRQDAPSCFDIATVAYVASPNFVLKSSNLWDGKVRGVNIRSEHAIDIDNAMDFAIARFLKEQYLPSLQELKDD